MARISWLSAASNFVATVRAAKKRAYCISWAMPPKIL